MAGFSTIAAKNCHGETGNCHNRGEDLLRRGNDCILDRNLGTDKVAMGVEEASMARELQILTVCFVFAFLGAIVTGFL